MSKQILDTEAAPKPIGPYSQAVLAEGRFVFCAGQLGLDPATGKLVEGGVSKQTEQALKNVQAILASAGLTLEAVVKTTVFLNDLKDFAAMNAVYVTFFGENPPARSTLGGLQLPSGALVEIECVAVAS